MRRHTDLDIVAVVVGNARVGGTCEGVSQNSSLMCARRFAKLTKIDTNGTVVNLVGAHDESVIRGYQKKTEKWWR